jgi:menaquinone-dependent protoporphyrinogen IX oxidase
MGSPIGQLTSGDSGNSAQKHKEALQTIENTTQGVNNLKRSLSEQEQETVVQIKTFLKQAKQALTAEDVDGALNLANKAKVLLTELTK